MAEDSATPQLEGVITLTDAALALGISRQAMHKLAARKSKTGELKTVRRVGPIRIMSVEEFETLKNSRL